jgi:hypothetical protein
MDALTHTILAVACMAVAYYGGRALQIREARRMWGDIATPEMKREIELMDALIKRMSREDRQYIAGISTDVSDHSEYEYAEPRQLELFAEHHEAPSK